MLFGIVWANRPSGTEETDKRVLKLFKNWQPPAGFEFKSFYDYADGNGGMAVAETSSSEAILEATAPWSAFFTFTVRPIIAADKASAIYEKGLTWRDAIR